MNMSDELREKLAAAEADVVNLIEAARVATSNKLSSPEYRIAFSNFTKALIARDRLRSASHEASHAVIYEIHGAKVSALDIIQRRSHNESGSILVFGRVSIDNCDCSAISRAIGVAAGPIGEAHFTRELLEPVFDGSDADRLRQLCCGDEELICEIKRRARRDVEANEIVIATVAMALVDRDCLSGEELRALISASV